MKPLTWVEVHHDGGLLTTTTTQVAAEQLVRNYETLGYTGVHIQTVVIP